MWADARICTRHLAEHMTAGGAQSGSVTARSDKTRLFFHTHPKRLLFSKSTVTHVFLFEIDEGRYMALQ